MKNNQHRFFSNNLHDSENIADNISHLPLIDSVIYLEGNIGSGKTFIARRIAANFGINNFLSSSFQVLSVYKASINLIHCDLYRHYSEPDLIINEIYEHLNSPWLLIIEWPKFIFPISAKNFYRISIINTSINTRTIEITIND